mmetsp:Transcript_28508/g.46024  ORF Transcript_28508/g.46024 Transcript_28508/m.46024 type:complete len:449 (-) Transcript_28508:629-1975(-)
MRKGVGSLQRGVGQPGLLPPLAGRARDDEDARNPRHDQRRIREGYDRRGLAADPQGLRLRFNLAFGFGGGDGLDPLAMRVLVVPRLLEPPNGVSRDPHLPLLLPRGDVPVVVLGHHPPAERPPFLDDVLRERPLALLNVAKALFGVMGRRGGVKLLLQCEALVLQATLLDLHFRMNDAPHQLLPIVEEVERPIGRFWVELALHSLQVTVWHRSLPVVEGHVHCAMRSVQSKPHHSGHAFGHMKAGLHHVAVEGPENRDGPFPGALVPVRPRQAPVAVIAHWAPEGPSGQTFGEVKLCALVVVAEDDHDIARTDLFVRADGEGVRGSAGADHVPPIGVELEGGGHQVIDPPHPAAIVQRDDRDWRVVLVGLGEVELALFGRPPPHFQGQALDVGGGHVVVMIVQVQFTDDEGVGGGEEAVVGHALRGPHSTCVVLAGHHVEDPDLAFCI